MRTVKLNGNLAAEPTVVDLFDKKYRLKPITRSVQKGLEAVQDKLSGLGEDADGDAVVDVITDGFDVLLGIEGQHRTSAKKLLLSKWNADELAVDQLEQFFEALQEAAAARPT